MTATMCPDCNRAMGKPYEVYPMEIEYHCPHCGQVFFKQRSGDQPLVNANDIARLMNIAHTAARSFRGEQDKANRYELTMIRALIAVKEVTSDLDLQDFCQPYRFNPRSISVCMTVMRNFPTEPTDKPHIAVVPEDADEYMTVWQWRDVYRAVKAGVPVDKAMSLVDAYLAACESDVASDHLEDTIPDADWLRERLAVEMEAYRDNKTVTGIKHLPRITVSGADANVAMRALGYQVPLDPTRQYTVHLKFVEVDDQ